MNLGERLYELRKSKNLSQEEVADKLNVTRQTVSKWETNQSTPDFDKIVPLSELFEIGVEELITGNKKESEEVKNEAQEEKKLSRNEIKQASAEVVSSSILLFFIAIAYVGIAVAVMNWDPVFVGCTFLILVGIGVTRIVKHYMSVPKYEKTQQEEKRDSIAKQINGIIGGISLVAYFIISFATMAWHITWVIFIISGLTCQVVKLIFMLMGEDVNEE